MVSAAYWLYKPLIQLLAVFYSTGGFEYHRDSLGHEQVHRLSPAASADPVCRSLCQHRALRRADRFHPANHLPAVQRPLAHQGSEGRHRGVSAGYLQVRPVTLGQIQLNQIMKEEWVTMAAPTYSPNHATVNWLVSGLNATHI